MVEPLLQFKGLRLHAQDGRELFQNLNWILPRGTKVRIRGESSSGTSELLRLAAGIAHPSEGNVVLDGLALDPYKLDHPFLGRGALGWVPPDGGLLVNQNLLTNLALPLRFIRGMARTASEAAATAALEEAGLDSLAKHRPHSLDIRERWLAALVRASLMEPALWLVDQASGDLNSRTRKAARRILDQVASGVETTLVVVGEGAWIPESLETLRLENGILAPEEQS